MKTPAAAGNSVAKGAPPSPERIFSFFNAYQRTAAIKAAVELGVFTSIDEGRAAAAAIAADCGASERGVRILCDFLVVSGLLEKKGGNYALAPDAAFFLSRKSPAYVGTMLGFLTDARIQGAFQSLTAAVKKGGCAQQSSVEPENPVWVEFAKSMAPMMAMPAERIADVLDAAAAPSLKVLDIAAGHGLFGIAVGRRCPGAEITALDWKAVLAVARENAEKAGLSGRYKLLPGSAFDVEYPKGQDVVLLTNFLHHFDEKTNVALLKKVRAALAPKGRAVILEFVPNEDRVTPPMPASFSLTMLASTPAGDAYTYAELERMCKAAGFAKTQRVPLEPSPETVVLAS